VPEAERIRVNEAGAPRRQRRSILLLADDNPGHANTVLDHIDALNRLSRHRVTLFNPRGLKGSRFLRLSNYDVVVIHYSLLITSDDYLAPSFREALHAYSGLKVQFIQDEYRWIDQITLMMEYLGVDVIFSAAAEVDLPRLYTNRLPGVTAVSTLTGFMPERLLGLRSGPLQHRPLDVGYRGRVVPYSLGALGQEKVAIARGFGERAAHYGLRCDIGWREEDRIYGQRWNEFIASCRTMLGTESGASIADFDGSIERRVNEYLAEHPEPAFEEVSEAVLAPYENNLPIRAISPRVFEAIALRTALVQFPGEYSGVVRPWDHYIPLEKDFSNMDEVVEKIRDTRFLREMTERAYADIAATGLYSYRAFAQHFDRVIDSLAPESRRGVLPIHHLARFEPKASAAAARLAVVEARLRPRALAAQRLSERQAWQALRQGARIVVVLRATFPRPPLRRLLTTVIKDPASREMVRDGSGLSDVLRLAVLAAASEDPQLHGFHPTVHFDTETSTLRFTSRGLSDDARSDVDWTEVRRTIAAARLEHVVWSHAAVGNAFEYPLIGEKHLRFHVGRENPSVHSFERLVELARRFPTHVSDALESVRPADHGVEGAGTLALSRDEHRDPATL
jgi:hypothetical protein